MTDIVERLNDSLSAGYSELRKEAAAEITRLRARIEAMEQQEPVKHEFQGRDGVWYPFIDQRHHENTVADGSWPVRALYTLPGAQPAPSVQDVPAKSLKPVIDWLRSGCDPMKAADELELIAAAPEAKP